MEFRPVLSIEVCPDALDRTTTSTDTDTNADIETGMGVAGGNDGQLANAAQFGPTSSTQPGENQSEPSDTTASPESPDSSGGGIHKSADDQLCYHLGPSGGTGGDLSSAKAMQGEDSWVINVTVRNASRESMNAMFNACYQGDATCPPQGTEGRGAVGIVVDGKVVSAPAVNGPDLAADQFTISGNFSEAEAQDLANQLS